MQSHGERQPASSMSQQQGPQPREPLGDVAEQAKAEAERLTREARQQGISWLDRQKDQTASTLEMTGKAIQEVGHKLEQQGQGMIGEYAETAAKQVEHLSQFLKQRDVEQLMREMEYTARRQPAYFLGGAFALGFLAARFLRSSAPRDGDMQGRTGGQMSGHISASGYHSPSHAAMAGSGPSSIGSSRQSGLTGGEGSSGRQGPGSPGYSDTTGGTGYPTSSTGNTGGAGTVGESSGAGISGSPAGAPGSTGGSSGSQGRTGGQASQGSQANPSNRQNVSE